MMLFRLMSGKDDGGEGLENGIEVLHATKHYATLYA